MPKGFFASSLVIGDAPSSLLPKCGACGLFQDCKSPKMPWSGKGRKKILIVGEFPGEAEDLKGKHFAGKAGQYLAEQLEKLGIDMREDCWLTNAVICRPPGNVLKNKRAVDYCRPNLVKTVSILQPVVIILLGGSAIRSYIGEIWRENPGSVARWAGWQIPVQKGNVWVCPTYHPSFILREENEILERMFRKHLRLACEKQTVPWEVVPDWDSQIEVVLDVEKAARIVHQMEIEGGQFAFDYENNCIKPETKRGRILCASLCQNGKRTISFPWHGAVIQAVQKLLRSKRCSFIASNLKHENRWTIAEFGKGVRNWVWDTMLAAHVIDNRKAICSLKFQAFIYLGRPSYDDHIKRFLRATKEKQTNLAATEVDLSQLLFYCAVDSLLEYLLAVFQCKLLAKRK